MTCLEGEELEKLIEETGKKFEEDTQFLIEHGWTKTEKKELNGEKVFSVWIGPDGKEYGHQNCLFGSNNWTDAIDKAEMDLITDKHFESFVLSSTCPELNEDFNKRRSRKDSIWDEWAYFIHPTSRRVYSYLEAVRIARYRNMNDLDIESECCGKTQQIQTILTEQNIEPRKNMVLFLEFLRENRETHFYRFHSVVFEDLRS